MPRPRLAISPGEPAGIGPDLCLMLKAKEFDAALVIIADPKLLAARALRLGLDFEAFHIIHHANDIIDGRLNVLAVNTDTEVKAGQLDSRNAAYVLQCLEQAVNLCETGFCQAMVTGPVNKAVINDAGITFSGHTEWLANRTASPQVVMMLANPELRVALATTHIPLSDVAAAIQFDDLLTTIRIINRDLAKHFALAQARILVCGLNPHAGENGYLGREEIDTIIPVIQQAQREGIHAIGPLPADTAFTPRSLAKADVVLAMYHDQGLPVLKHQGFGESVNITLGLPIIRTSVDHGTALDIAASGKAEPGSLKAAINMAINMANNMANNITSNMDGT